MEEWREPLSGNEKKAKELALILRLNQSVVSSLDIDAVMQIITDGMSDLLGTDSAAVYFPDTKGKFYLGAATPNLPEKVSGQVRSRKLEDFPFILKTLEEKKPQLIPDTIEAELTAAEREEVEKRNLRTCLFIPFLLNGDATGLLALSTVGRTKSHTVEDIEMAQDVANHLALSLNNAILHRELKKKEFLLSNSLKITKLGYWEYDIKENVFIFSDELFEMLRTSADQHGGYRITPVYYAENFLFPEDRHIVIEGVRSLTAETKPDRIAVFEHRIRYGDGEEGYVSVSVRTEQNNEGEIVRTLGTHQDLTKSKLHELHLQQALEKAQESDRLKSAFLANISHEIRTPLNGIMGFSVLLNDPNLTDEEKNEYAALINDCGERLLSIVDDIIDISKIETNQIEVDPEPCKLNELLESLIHQHELETTPKGNELKLQNFLHDAQPTVMVDCNRLAQVLSNLLSNANKFTQSGKITLTCKLQADSLFFEVSDTGIGIDSKFHDQIFERFMQIDHGTTMLSSGNGLGLSISKAIVKLLGGEIEVDSSPGKGSRFYFSIPYNPLKNEKKALEPSNIISTNPKPFTVLIAEDETTNFIYLNALLKSYDCEILHAKNGREAVEIHDSRNDIDLILMDLKMPGMGGLEATKIIRSSDKTVPIIAQTAYAMQEDQQRILESGCTHYLHKPIDRDLFKQTIDDFLQSISEPR